MLSLSSGCWRLYLSDEFYYDCIETARGPMFEWEAAKTWWIWWSKTQVRQAPSSSSDVRSSRGASRSCARFAQPGVFGVSERVVAPWRVAKIRWKTVALPYRTRHDIASQVLLLFDVVVNLNKQPANNFSTKQKLQIFSSLAPFNAYSETRK